MTSASPPVSSGPSSSLPLSASASAGSPPASAPSATFSGPIDPRQIAAATLVATLRECETLAGALYAAQGRLADHAIAAEQAFALSAVTGQRFLAHLDEARRDTLDARGGLVSGHRMLEAIGKGIGLDVSMYGDAGKPPVPAFTSAELVDAPEA